MVAPTKLRLEMDGKWDIDDLSKVASSLQRSYALLYRFSVPLEDTVVARKHRRFPYRRLPWSRVRYFFMGWDHFIDTELAEDFYADIPLPDRLQVESIHHSSPGWLEVAGVVAVMSALSFCIRSWITTFDRALELFKKVEKFFEERSGREDEEGEEPNGPREVDEAYDLCREYGALLDLSDEQMDGMIQHAGDPISALQLFRALMHESRQISELEREGKVKLPRE